jgi:hypothetical protein
MPAFVKTKKQEELWARAKEQAAKAGHAEEWDYVTAIYKQMNGGKVALLETQTISRVATKWLERTSRAR